jgi:hypothetical protein
VKPGGVIYANPSGDGTYNIIISPDNMQATQSTLQKPDKRNDLAGVYSPSRKTLYYHPDYKNELFGKIQPRLLSDGRYAVTLMSINREPVQSSVHIIPANPQQLFEINDEDSAKFNKDGFTSTGELIMEKWDTTSATWYRFYKNAKCKRWKEPNEGTCGPVYVKDSTGKYVETGKSHKIATTGESHCYKGTEFCTEMYVIAIIEYLYDDANCKRLVKIKHYGGWSCE